MRKSERSNTSSDSIIRESREGFTLVEMLVVIGIIGVLVGASIGGYSAMTRSADRARAQELVSNVATALTALYQQEGNWPKRLATNGGSDGELNESASLPLARGYISLTTVGSGKDMKLAGNDRFGLVSPWATAAIKRRGSSAKVEDVVNGSATIKDHLLHYALDLDGDGIIKGALVGGVSVDIRATAAVWCGGKDGVIDPYPYNGRREKGGQDEKTGPTDDVYSWTAAQTRNVQ